MFDIIFNPWLDLVLFSGAILFGLYILFFKRKEHTESSVDSEKASSIANELRRIGEEFAKQQEQIARLQSMVETVMQTQANSTTKQHSIIMDDFSRGRDAYLRMEKELFEKHRGEFVAIYDGKLIDTDSNKIRLIARVRKELGLVRAFIQKIEDDRRGVKLPTSRRLKAN